MTLPADASPDVVATSVVYAADTTVLLVAAALVAIVALALALAVRRWRGRQRRPR